MNSFPDLTLNVYRITVFRNVMPCSLVDTPHVCRNILSHSLNYESEYGPRRKLKNIYRPTYLLSYTASRPGRQSDDRHTTAIQSIMFIRPAKHDICNYM